MKRPLPPAQRKLLVAGGCTAQGLVPSGGAVGGARCPSRSGRRGGGPRPRCPPCPSTRRPRTLLENVSAVYADGEELPVPEFPRPAMIGSLYDMAPLLWSSDYSILFNLEQYQLEEDAGLMTAAQQLKAGAVPSTYAQRGGDGKRKCKETGEKETQQAMVMAASALRQANQCRHSFSCAARSLVALSKRLPYGSWRFQAKQRTLLDRKTTIKLLKLMMDCKPELPFMESFPIQHFVFDQKYCKKGESRGKHRGVERVDSSGDLVELVAVVIVNTMRIPVPATLPR